jgi:glycosyltransferase involved in cell wall biosynthesis
MDRTIHLKKTYVNNVVNNLDYPNIEFILLNYGSKDDMEDWAKGNLSEFIEKGIVKYYHTTEPEKFHACKAKNLAHRLATGDILVNLDADNYLGKNFAHYVNYCFRINDKISCQFAGKGFRFFDTCGKIALTRDDFINSGGYNEELAPFAGEDIDLLKRLEVMGNSITVVPIINFLRTVKHDNKLRLKNIGNNTMEDMRRINKCLTEKYVTNNKYRVNIEGFTPYTVTENFSAKTIRI